MRADEARRIVEEMRDCKGIHLQPMVKESIESAVRKGATEVRLELDIVDQHRLSQWLSGLGYTVESGDKQRDGPWFSVSW
jgi:hypothetical protein